jgi:filamentous hemagglutinin family protein
MNGILVSGILFGWTTCAVAQRRPIADETLGNERSRITPLDPTAPIDLIEGGAQRGNNLFHSFREFHVEQGRGVYFRDPGVDNIVSRVTGGIESQILGVLGVQGGNANLFLINPSGIIFGPNARLDVRGSFTATTADAIQFGDQGWFNATDPTALPLLTVQPSAFLFNQIHPAPIANNSQAPAAANPSGLPGFGLRVPEGKRLTLVGGNISMNRGGVTALGGQVEIGGLSEPGTIALKADGSLGFLTGVARSDVALTNRSFIDVAADGGGSITVNAGKLELLDSVLSAGIGTNSGSVGAQAGDIMLNASTIRGRESAGIGNLVGVGGVGNGGDVRITADSLFLANGTRLQTTTFGQGNAGNVIINARDRVSLDGPNQKDLTSAILSNVGNDDPSMNAVGNGGDIRITTGSLSLTNGGELQAITYGQGNAGNVIINARDRVFVDGIPSSIISAVGDSSDMNAVGNGGDIHITAGSLFVTNGAELIAGTAGQGNAGNIIINAREDFSLTNGALLTTTTFGQGNAGNIIINAPAHVVVDNAPIFSTVGSYLEDVVAVGNGGDIRITTGSLSLTNGGELQAITYGQGNAGNVIINAHDLVLLDGVNQEGFLSGIFTATLTGAQGRGGDVHIAADTVRLADRARISAETLNRFSGGSITINVNTFEVVEGGQVVTATSNQGSAGNIILNAVDRITLYGVTPNYNDLEDPSGGGMFSDQGAASGLFANTTLNSSGQGGTIQLATGQLQVLDQARISVNSQGSGVAGNIDITASTVQLNDQAHLTAETAAADGGNITLRDVGFLLLRNGSVISTTAGTDFAGGNGGNINVDADFIVAVLNENSDIRANAFSGNGGTVRITTQGLFGIASQPQDNPFTSDITASSEQGVQGSVSITQPDVDLRRGLTELPVAVVDAANQITQTCPSAGARRETGEFVVKGRGGLPSSPMSPLTGDESFADWATLDKQGEAKTVTTAPPKREPDRAAPIVEAQGWIISDDGAVQLIAATSVSAVQHPATCP